MLIPLNRRMITEVVLSNIMILAILLNGALIIYAIIRYFNFGVYHIIRTEEIEKIFEL